MEEELLHCFFATLNRWSAKLCLCAIVDVWRTPTGITNVGSELVRVVKLVGELPKTVIMKLVSWPRLPEPKPVETNGQSLVAFIY